MKKLTCSYGTTCALSMVEHDGIPLMLFDMNIDEYTIHLGENSGVYKFAGNAVISDKRYLNKEQSELILQMLDCFIESTYLDMPEAKKTQRGFKFIENADVYGNKLSIQESSNIDPAIWFGVDVHEDDVKVWKNNELVKFDYPSTKILIKDRLHLKLPQAKKLRKIIAGFWGKE